VATQRQFFKSQIPRRDSSPVAIDDALISLG
jgi:hypothetical protein